MKIATNMNNYIGKHETVIDENKGLLYNSQYIKNPKKKHLLALKVLLRLSSIFSVFNERRVTHPIKVEEILWNNRPIKEKSVLLWDLENIPFSRLSEIKTLVKYTPDELYVITKQKLGEKHRKKITNQHFKILDRHKSISDDKIISIMKLYNDRENMVLISADSDFAREANKYIKKNKLHWILTDENKKRVLMYVNLASTNLTLSSLVKIKNIKKTPATKHPKVIKSPIKIETQESRFLVYISYYKGKINRVLKRLRKVYRTIKYHLEKSEKSEKVEREEKIVEIKIDNPSHGKRYIFRRNYRGRRVKAGYIQFNGNEDKILKLYKNLMTKYHMPSFEKIIRFKDFEEVSELIHFHYSEDEYYLNEFERVEII